MTAAQALQTSAGSGGAKNLAAKRSDASRPLLRKARSGESHQRIQRDDRSVSLQAMTEAST